MKQTSFYITCNQNVTVLMRSFPSAEPENRLSSRTAEEGRKGYRAALNFKRHGPDFQGDSVRKAALQRGRMRAAAPMGGQDNSTL